MGHSLVMLAFRKNGQKSNTDRQTVYPKLSIQNKQNYHLTPKDIFCQLYKCVQNEFSYKNKTSVTI